MWIHQGFAGIFKDWPRSRWFCDDFQASVSSRASFLPKSGKSEKPELRAGPKKPKLQRREENKNPKNQGPGRNRERGSWNQDVKREFWPRDFSGSENQGEGRAKGEDRSEKLSLLWKKKTQKTWEIAENRELFHFLGSGFGWRIKTGAGPSKGAAAPVFKEQTDQKREIKSGCDKLQPIVTAWTEVRKCEEEGKSRAAAQRTQCRAGSSSRGQKRN